MTLTLFLQELNGISHNQWDFPRVCSPKVKSGNEHKYQLHLELQNCNNLTYFYHQKHFNLDQVMQNTLTNKTEPP